ncbi:serine/arginine repetitive matrix protein 1-like [Phoenix dactylifera]|uniref:Serine/arginine repetitive matrix protein 1-like n=1 Tax=Phoenix dactylifera TaxID=42345 RepID=A0A8B9ASX9_PHODC|nr:serine/arginine repetitive matrix protein 1-like [Phoenix dactylifera]
MGMSSSGSQGHQPMRAHLGTHAPGGTAGARHDQTCIRPSAPQPDKPKGSARVGPNQGHSRATEPAHIGSGPASARAPECQGWKATVSSTPHAPEDTWQPSADQAPSQRRKATVSPTPRALADTWQPSADQAPSQRRKATVSPTQRATEDTWQPSAGQAPGQRRKATVSPAQRAPKDKWQPSTPKRKQGKLSKDCARPNPASRDTWQAAKHQRRAKPGKRTRRIHGGACRLFHGNPTRDDTGGQDATGRQMNARKEDTPAIQGSSSQSSKAWQTRKPISAQQEAQPNRPAQQPNQAAHGQMAASAGATCTSQASSQSRAPNTFQHMA